MLHSECKEGILEVLQSMDCGLQPAAEHTHGITNVTVNSRPTPDQLQQSW